MTLLRKSLYLDRAGIKNLTKFTADDGTGVQEWLDALCVKLEDNYKLQRDAVLGRTAAETPNWFIRESDAADLAAGRTKAVGNLIVIHKTTGTKREFGA